MALLSSMNEGIPEYKPLLQSRFLGRFIFGYA